MTNMTPEHTDSNVQSITENAPTKPSVFATGDNTTYDLPVVERFADLSSMKAGLMLNSISSALTTILGALQSTLHELKGAQRNIYLVLALLLANWLGNAVYNSLPLVGGLPTAIGTVYLCSLVLRTKREEAMKLLREYIG